MILYVMASSALGSLMAPAPWLDLAICMGMWSGLCARTAVAGHLGADCAEGRISQRAVWVPGLPFKCNTPHVPIACICSSPLAQDAVKLEIHRPCKRQSVMTQVVALVLLWLSRYGPMTSAMPAYDPSCSEPGQPNHTPASDIPVVYDRHFLEALAQPSDDEVTILGYTSVLLALPDGTRHKIAVDVPRSARAISLICEWCTTLKFDAGAAPAALPATAVVSQGTSESSPEEVRSPSRSRSRSPRDGPARRPTEPADEPNPVLQPISVRLQGWAAQRHKLAIAQQSPWRDCVPWLLEKFHQMYVLAPQLTYTTGARRQQLLQQHGACERFVVEHLQFIFRNDAPYGLVRRILPEDASPGQREAFDALVLYAFLEVFRSPPILDSPTQLWSETHLGPAPVPHVVGEVVSPTAAVGAMPQADPEVASMQVAAALGVPQGQLVIATPPDGNCLFHCITAWQLGSIWELNRDTHGFSTNPVEEKIHAGLAKALRRRLIRFLERVGRQTEADRLRLEGPAGYPGADELPYLAELMGCTIIEHDLEHSVQPAFTHNAHGGDAAVVHIGHTVTENGGAHWVLLRSQQPGEDEETPRRADAASGGA